MKFEYLEHTADVKFRAYGDSQEKAFANAALATFNVMVDTSKVKGRIKKNVSAEGSDIQSLLYDFLEKFLILLDSENYFLSEVRRLKILRKGSEYTLEAETGGDDAGKYETIGPQVKAVTYNDMVIREENGTFMIQVVLDV